MFAIKLRWFKCHDDTGLSLLVRYNGRWTTITKCYVGIIYYININIIMSIVSPRKKSISSRVTLQHWYFRDHPVHPVTRRLLFLEYTLRCIRVLWFIILLRISTINPTTINLTLFTFAVAGGWVPSFVHNNITNSGKVY